MSITPHTKATATVGAFCGIVASMFLLGWRTNAALQEKANQGVVERMASAIGEKADKKEVDLLRTDLNELSAKRREDFIIQKNILSLLERMDVRMGKIEENQVWQMQQEVKRKEWEPFKREPVPSPTPNANR